LAIEFDHAAVLSEGKFMVQTHDKHASTDLNPVQTHLENSASEPGLSGARAVVATVKPSRSQSRRNTKPIDSK
jgi:hypothetical protein